jgi:beta-galactosidase beta subunit
MKGSKHMEDKIIDMEVQYKSRWEKFKYKTRDKIERAIRWVKEKPEQAAIVGSVVIVGADKLFKGIKKLKELQPTQAELDREWHDTHVYDRSLGYYYNLKRPMSGTEAMEFSQRKKRGESTGDILRSMNLLKR